jgi:26S proteasome regulatory subunit N9
MDTKDPLVYLQSILNQVPANNGIRELLVECQTLYDRKLWHPLSVQVKDLYYNNLYGLPIDNRITWMVSIYENFIQSWEKKASPFILAEIAALISVTMLPKSPTLPQPDHPGIQKALLFISSLIDRAPTQSVGSNVYLYSIKGWYLILMGNVEEARKAHVHSKQLLGDGLVTGLDTQVYASLHRLAAAIDHHVNDAGSFYHNALAFLQLIARSDDSPYWLKVLVPTPEQQSMWIEWICIAALLADNVYSFGGLVQHVLFHMPKQSVWIYNILMIFHKGNLSDWNTYISSQAKDPVITNNIDFLNQKIRIMALMEGIWSISGSSNDPQHDMSFSTIAQLTHTPEQEIEFLIMKTMSLGLIRGTIDQVSQIVHINWIQPRILDIGQIRLMHKQVTKWQEMSRSLVNSSSDWVVHGS